MNPHNTSDAAVVYSEASYGRSRWIAAITALVLLTEQTALGFTLIAPTLGRLSVKYQTTQIAWMITAFLLVAAVATPILGKLGDNFGKKRMLLLAGVIGFGGAVVCALAPTYAVMLLGRALMGASGAFMTLSYALIRDVFPENYRNLSISIITNGVGIVTIVGPFLAGFLIDTVSLESVFWFVAAISFLGVVGVHFLVPETLLRSSSRLDFPGACGLSIGLLALMYGISNLGVWGATNVRALGAIGSGFVVLVLWWKWERRTPEPFIDISLLTSRPVATVVLAFSFSTAAIQIGACYLPTMLQTPRSLGIDYGFGLDATGVAFFFIPAGILTVLAGLLAGVCSRKFGFRVFLTTGAMIVCLGCLMLGLLRAERWMPMLGYGLIGLGSMVYAAGAGLLMEVVPKKLRGVAAGMMSAVAGAVGSAIAQLAGLILSRNGGQIVNNYPVYASSAWVAIFLLGAVIAAIGLVVSLFVPREAQRIAG